jgi:PPOX class probable F420-dependent enzyme
VSGAVDIEIGDGTVKRLGVGDILIAEDTTGQGHGTLYVFTAGDSGKVKRLRRSPRARIAPCNSQGKLPGPWRDATARLVTDVAVIGRAQAAIAKKYGWQKWLLDLGSRLTGRIRRRAWIAIDVMTQCSH